MSPRVQRMDDESNVGRQVLEVILSYEDDRALAVSSAEMRVLMSRLFVIGAVADQGVPYGALR